MAAIISALAGGGLKGVADIINSIKGKSPEDAAKLAQINADLQEIQIKYQGDFALAEINENVQLNQAAAANIQAEAKSGRYAADARPSVIYAGILIALANYACIGFFPAGWGFKPVDVPSVFWQIWCACVLGYTVMRTVDKNQGGAGGSINLPFGIKFDSKGDTPAPAAPSKK